MGLFKRSLDYDALNENLNVGLLDFLAAGGAPANSPVNSPFAPPAQPAKQGFNWSKGFQEGVGGWGGLLMSLGDYFNQIALAAAEPSYDGFGGAIARGMARGSAGLGQSFQRNRALKNQVDLRDYIEGELANPDLPDEERKLLESYNRGGKDLGALQLRLEAIRERRARTEAAALAASNPYSTTPADRARDRVTLQARQEIMRNPSTIGRIVQTNPEANSYRFSRRPLRTMADPDFESYYAWSEQAFLTPEDVTPFESVMFPSLGEAGDIIDGATGGEGGMSVDPDAVTTWDEFTDALGFGPDQRPFLERVTGADEEERSTWGPGAQGDQTPGIWDSLPTIPGVSGLMDFFGMSSAAGTPPSVDAGPGRDTVRREEALRAYRPGPLQLLQEAPEQVMDALAGVPGDLAQAGDQALGTLAAYASPEAIAARAERAARQPSAYEIGVRARENFGSGLDRGLETLSEVPEQLEETWQRTLSGLGF